jgi:HEAT repeat protein
METETQERSGIMGGVAKVLNAGGSAVVIVYDAAAGVFCKLIETVKKAPDLHEKTMGLFTRGIGIVKPGEINRIEKKITEYETQIKQLYFEIGKEGARFSEDERPLESDIVKKLISDVKEYEKEIERLHGQIAEIKEDKAAEALRKSEQKKTVSLAKLKEKVKKDKATDEQINRLVDSAIKKAIKNGEFESRSEMEIFSKVAGDFLDNEMEIKCLAAAELGKIGNHAAVPILLEAAKFESLDLTSEIINSLITIGDARAIPLFKQEVYSTKYRVRIGCLRGLYKLADTEDAMPLLIEALRDDHPEVRRTALTFIGWKDYAEAVPSVMQCLRDEESRVRRAAVSTLANLKDSTSILPLINVLGDKDLEVREKALEAIQVILGEDIVFDVHASRKALAEAIDTLKDWWQTERLGKDKSVGSGLTVDVEMPPDVIYTAETVDTSAAVMAETVESEIEIETAVSDDEFEPVVSTAEAETGVSDIEIEIAETVIAAEPSVLDVAIEENESPNSSDAIAEDGAGEEIEPSPDETVLSRAKLQKMSKSELMAMCEERNIKTDRLAKSEMVEMLAESLGEK